MGEAPTWLSRNGISTDLAMPENVYAFMVSDVAIEQAADELFSCLIAKI